MGLNADSLAHALSTDSNGASSIVNSAQSRETSSKGSDPDSLILAYARGLLNDCRQYKGINAVGVLRAGLNYQITGDAPYIGSALISGGGYDVYIINQGQVINNGERGFINWTVVGNSKQDNNVINVPG